MQRGSVGWRVEGQTSQVIRRPQRLNIFSRLGQLQKLELVSARPRMPCLVLVVDGMGIRDRELQRRHGGGHWKESIHTCDHHELSMGIFSSPARRKMSSLKASLLSDAPIVAYRALGAESRNFRLAVRRRGPGFVCQDHLASLSNVCWPFWP
jgi:hypothetical protein